MRDRRPSLRPDDIAVPMQVALHDPHPLAHGPLRATPASPRGSRSRVPAAPAGGASAPARPAGARFVVRPRSGSLVEHAGARVCGAPPRHRVRSADAAREQRTVAVLGPAKPPAVARAVLECLVRPAGHERVAIHQTHIRMRVERAGHDGQRVGARPVMVPAECREIAAPGLADAAFQATSSPPCQRRECSVSPGTAGMVERPPGPGRRARGPRGIQDPSSVCRSNDARHPGRSDSRPRVATSTVTVITTSSSNVSALETARERVLSYHPGRAVKRIESVCILCTARDAWLARIAVASVRYWSPEIPITLREGPRVRALSHRRSRAGLGRCLDGHAGAAMRLGLRQDGDPLPVPGRRLLILRRHHTLRRRPRRAR